MPSSVELLLITTYEPHEKATGMARLLGISEERNTPQALFRTPEPGHHTLRIHAHVSGVKLSQKEEKSNFH